MPTKLPTPYPTSLPAQPTGNPAAAGCASASSFGVPGLFEAEQYCNQQGVFLQTTSDLGGGNDVVEIDGGDYV
eukprot:14906807-Ditylum_brightwellii.AAC.1